MSFEAFLVAGRSDGFENGLYLSYMVVLSERLKEMVFLARPKIGMPFWGGGKQQAATLTVRSSNYVTAQTWWQIDH